MNPVSAIKSLIRSVMRRVAIVLNKLFAGKLTPNTVTIIGFLMHIPVAVLIAMGYPHWAALGLFVFGLFDTLDGELARLQGTSSPHGMLLDASTDRMKEVLIYTGVAYFFATGAHPTYAAWATAALGASVCVSYVKAKGEAAIASGSQKISHDKLNHLFKDGLLTFEIRMFLLLVGLIFGYLVWIVAVIAILASYTALQRLVRIGKVVT